MKPVSINAFYIHLNAYESEICTYFHEKKISSATYSAISIFLNDSDPDAYGVDETFLDEEFSSLFDWVSTNEGVLDYLETRYQEAVADPLEGDDETWLFYIGDTYSCPYKSYEEFKSELDINMILKIFKKCWERSCKNEYPNGRQLPKDFPEYKIDYSKNKKLVGDELLKKIKSDILPKYENIKEYGYIALNQNGEEIANLDEFLQEHRNALETAKNNGKEIKDHLFPSAQKIGKLSKGKYLIGDLSKCLPIADKNLVDELKALERFKSFDDVDEDLGLPIYIEDLNDNENKKLEIYKSKKDNDSQDFYLCGLKKKSDGSSFLYILPMIDESSFQDDKGGRYFQSSNCLICIKVDDEYVNKEANINSYLFEEDFECVYYDRYDTLKLGDFHVYADY
ncbi:hypothetical protein CU311_01945 [Prochlorococcus marinus str. MU1402]|uniref:hypothetical protein n=1 Tax=Prochlorococcus marinus TaxID=1219 RepID=UPI001AD9E0C7|nr:hypothetical protein [Prochlorococcus marinus]MBO8231406.1 hypothetical protein [Prochlorococcus marinus XMU1402]MBW3056168.1 hypothetical protein [Prochlorococcus marinus str. MU1402]